MSGPGLLVLWMLLLIDLKVTSFFENIRVFINKDDRLRLHEFVLE